MATAKFSQRLKTNQAPQAKEYLAKVMVCGTMEKAQECTAPEKIIRMEH